MWKWALAPTPVMWQSSSSVSSVPESPSLRTGKVKDYASSRWVATGEKSFLREIIWFFFFLIKHLSSFTDYSYGSAWWERVSGPIPHQEYPKWSWSCTYINKLLFAPLMHIYLNRSTAIQGHKKSPSAVLLCAARRPPSSFGRLLLLLAELWGPC